MTSDSDHSKAAAAAKEIWPLARFLEELRRSMQSVAPPPVPNVLAEVVKKIELNPAFSQSRLLTRVLSALTYQSGEFRRAEIYILDSQTRAMVIALVDTFAAGIPVREEWIRAVDSAHAAQLAFG